VLLKQYWRKSVNSRATIPDAVRIQFVLLKIGM